MKTLPNNYSKNGSDFALMERKGNIAIYSQSLFAKVYAYEVFKVQSHRARIIKGSLIAACESTPSNEQWGTKGFTYWKYADAQRRARKMRGDCDIQISDQPQPSHSVLPPV